MHGPEPTTFGIDLRNENGGCKQGRGNRPSIDDRNPIRKFSIDCLEASKINGKTWPHLTSQCRQSKRKTNTVVDTDVTSCHHVNCRHRFCGLCFRPLLRESFAAREIKGCPSAVSSNQKPSFDEKPQIVSSSPTSVRHNRT